MLTDLHQGYRASGYRCGASGELRVRDPGGQAGHPTCRRGADDTNDQGQARAGVPDAFEGHSYQTGGLEMRTSVTYISTTGSKIVTRAAVSWK